MIDARSLAEANKWLEEYRRCWRASFSRLDVLLGELQSAPKKRPRKR